MPLVLLVLFISFFPLILSVRYMYMQGMDPSFIAVLVAVPIGIGIVEKLTSTERSYFFHTPWWEKPAIIGPLLMCVLHASVFGNWMESQFWGVSTFILLALCSWVGYKNT